MSRPVLLLVLYWSLMAQNSRGEDSGKDVLEACSASRIAAASCTYGVMNSAFKQNSTNTLLPLATPSPTRPQSPEGQAIFEQYAEAAKRAHALGMSDCQRACWATCVSSRLFDFDSEATKNHERNMELFKMHWSDSGVEGKGVCRTYAQSASELYNMASTGSPSFVKGFVTSAFSQAFLKKGVPFAAVINSHNHSVIRISGTSQGTLTIEPQVNPIQGDGSCKVAIYDDQAAKPQTESAEGAH